MDIPKTKEDYLKMLKMAFREGQKHTEAVHITSMWDDVDDENYTKPSCTFEYWANQIWKYGKVKGKKA